MWNQLLKSFVKKFVKKEEDVELVFDKLLNDAAPDLTVLKKPLMVSAALDSVGQRFVLELIQLLDFLPGDSKLLIETIYNDYEEVLEKNKFGLIVIRRLQGIM